MELFEAIRREYEFGVGTIAVVIPRPPESEAEVVAWLKTGLTNHGLRGRTVREILVDADGSYLSSPFRRQLEPTGTIWIGGRRPDLVCIVEDGQTQRLAGFEVKRSVADFTVGVAQASFYREGVHEAYLCLPALDGKSVAALPSFATQNGVGVVRVWRGGLDVQVPPALPRPDPVAAAATQRSLLGSQTVRALMLNRPLHYAAALFAFAFRPDPVASLRSEWANDDSLARHAIRGARTLGLIVAGGATLSGRAYADILRTLGFDLATARPLTSRSKRLVRDAPGYAAVLRSILLAQPAVELIVRALLKVGGGPVKIEALAHCATTIDEGLAQAVFGAPPVDAQPWYIRPSTRFNLKAGLYDVGVLESKLAPGAGYRQMPNGPYDPGTDDWEIGKALLTGTHHVLDA